MLYLDQILYHWVHHNQFWKIKRLSKSTGELPAVAVVRWLLSRACGRSTPFLCEAVFCIYCCGDLESRHMWPSRWWMLGTKQKYSGCVRAFENLWVPSLTSQKRRVHPSSLEPHILQRGIKKTWLLTQSVSVGGNKKCLVYPVQKNLNPAQLYFCFSSHGVANDHRAFPQISHWQASLPEPEHLSGSWYCWGLTSPHCNHYWKMLHFLGALCASSLSEEVMLGERYSSLIFAL